MYDRGFDKQVTAKALAAGATSLDLIFFPKAARIEQYWAAGFVAEAAHASQAVTVTFTNRGTDGLGSTVLATITNDTDLPNTATRKNGAYVAKVFQKLLTGARPDGSGGSYDAIAAGSSIEVSIGKAAGTATGDVYAGVTGFYSS